MDSSKATKVVAPTVNEQSRMERFVSMLLVLLLLGLAAWTFFDQLGEGSLYDWDEATYGQIAREMARSDEWLTPQWNGQPFFDKPPVVLWLMALVMERSSSPELAVRLPAALFGLLTILLTIVLGRTMLGRGAGLIAAALLLVASPHFSSNFVGLSRQGMLDVPLTAMAVWAILHLWLGLRNRWHWVIMGVPLGLAIMIRSFSAGPLFVVIALCVLLLPLVGQKLDAPRWRALAGGLVLAGLVALPWHLAQLLQHGQAFFDDYVGRNLFGLATETAENLEGDWTYYFNVLREGLPAWWWLLPPSLAWAGWQLLRVRDPKAMILLVWGGLPFLLYTLAASNLAWYILIIYPALALLVGGFISALTSRSWPLQAALIVGLLLATALWNRETIKPIHFSWAVQAVGWCTVNTVPSGEAIAFFDPNQSYKSDQREFWNIRPSVRYYADRPMIARWERATIEQWLAEGGRFVWSNTDDAPQLDGLLVVVGREDNQLLLRSAHLTDPPPAPEWACHQ